MPLPQAVVAPITRSAIFLVATVQDDEPVRALCGDLAALVRAVGHRVPSGNLTCVTGFGSDAWDRLFGDPRPAELHPFREFTGARHRAPSTPGDVLFHIRAEEMDLCFELATLIMSRIAGAVTVVDEVHGFRYFDMRSMVGFVDGTENPVGQTAADSTLIGTEDPDFEAGSYVIVQKYLHDMTAWNALTVEAQERVIGRTKLSDVELTDQPTNSHVALNIIEENGQELKILRDNMPFGRPGSSEFGTYFIGYARSPRPTELMLENMFIGRPPGNHDRLLDFSRAVTGTVFFVPSEDLLEELANRQPSVAPISDGSLKIGSLKGIPQR